MLVEMKRQQLNTLDDERLIWACIEPTVREIRGKSLAVKMTASGGLTQGQRALLMLQVMLGHSREGIENFFCQLEYMLSNRGVWKAFRNSALLFRDGRLQQLYGRMESCYFEKTEDLAGLDAELSEILPGSVKKAAAYIRGFPDEFIRWVD
jgi:hypothetical protein